ncbi:permease [Streptomyces sp. LaPpAH-108]|uniref:permease n=1 Tax=Streptomyces sp. LaPpAH-108 TaxID=1155714 RepID=UPI00035D5DB7|nr:permease [Streptomyces sp. LaPpAH-108]
MTAPSRTHQATPGPGRAPLLTGFLVAVVVFVVVLLWAKWLPYTAKAVGLNESHTWSGSSILGVGGVQPGEAPSRHAAVSFLVAYLVAVWKALVAALLISAALQALIPRDWLVRVLDRRGRWSGAVAGGLLSTPSMMCTCCTAPVAVSLRRSGASTAATVAYWLGNPLLNPAVVVFLLLVAPWQWTVVRVVIGVVTVVAGAVLVSHLADRRRRASAGPAASGQSRAVGVPVASAPGEPAGPKDVALRFLRTLTRMTLVLVPEYLLVVLLIGAFRGWMLPLTQDAVGHGMPTVVAATVIAAILGTLFVIPTAGEIPIVQGLAVLGLPAGVLGALLITLPAISLPSMAMVGRTLGWRLTTATTVLVVLAGLLGGVLLAVL